MRKTKHIEEFTIKNFKKFKNLKLNDIGQINLIVGDNNVGKTSLLESLLFSENRMECFKNIHRTLCYREIHFHQTYTENYFKYIFSIDNTLEFGYKYLNEDKQNTIKINVIHLEDLNKSDKNEIKKKVIIPNPLPKYWTRFKLNDNSSEIDFLYADEIGALHGIYLPYIPFQLGYDNDLVDFYSSLTKESKSFKKELINDLKIFIPDIEDIEILEFHKKKTYISIRLTSREEAFPLSSFGDGAVKLVRLLLEIGQSKNSRLMVDEIDTGVHFSRFKNFWSAIINAALKNRVQLFATTHNIEALKYFKDAFNDNDLSVHKEKARHLRMKNLPDKSVKVYTYRFEEFEFAIEQNNDLR